MAANDAKDQGCSRPRGCRCRAHQSPHAGLGQPGARRHHPAGSELDRFERAARCAARSHQGPALHHLRGHAQNPARHRRAGRHPRLFLQEAGRSRAELRQDVRAGAHPARAVQRHRAWQAAGHLPRSRAVLRRRGSRRGRRPQGHSPQPGRRDGLFRHRGLELHRYRVQPALPVDRPRTVPRVRCDQADRHAGEPDQERRSASSAASPSKAARAIR